MLIDKKKTVHTEFLRILEVGTRRSVPTLLLILLFVGVCTGLHSFSNPFWYDEICTVIMCRLPNVSAIWQALRDAADTNPPLYYLAARLTHHIVGDDHLGLRLPSILGLLSTISCIYFILARRVNSYSALLGATFILCTPLVAYGSEARPYALMVACVAGAALAWQRLDDSVIYPFWLALGLAAAVSLHYYAVFVWPAFLLAEASQWLLTRRFRFTAWLAIAFGAAPLLMLADLLAKLRQYYGQHFWARPAFAQVFYTHNWLFNFGSNWGRTIAAALTVWLIYQVVRLNKIPIQTAVKESSLIAELVLVTVLLWVPAIAFAVAKIGHGGLFDRYMLPAVLGGALAIGYLSGRLPQTASFFFLVLVLVNYVFSSTDDLKRAIRGSLRQQRLAAVSEIKQLTTQPDSPRLPVVISSGLRYLAIAYYSPPNSENKVYALVDPPAAIEFFNSDSVDLALIVLQRYFPLRVENYEEFASRYPEFLLVSQSKGSFDWWPARFLHDRVDVRLVRTVGDLQIFKVTLRQISSSHTFDDQQH